MLLIFSGSGNLGLISGKLAIMFFLLFFKLKKILKKAFNFFKKKKKKKKKKKIKIKIKY